MEAQSSNQNQTQQQSKPQTSGSGTQPIEPIKSGKPLAKLLPFLLFIVIIGAGIVTGLVLSSINKAQSQSGDILSEEDLSPEIKQNFSQTFKDEFVGKKVKVYGETFGSDQVSWLMDVGKVEVIE